jgi:hypothetical protein
LAEPLFSTTAMNRRDFLRASVAGMLPLKAPAGRLFQEEGAARERPVSSRELVYGAPESFRQGATVSLPERIYKQTVPGRELSKLRRPLAMVSRYPIWVYQPEFSTVYSIRRVPGVPADKRIIQEQNDELEDYGIEVDILQFNPNPEYPDWELYQDNYLAVPSTRPFFVLYENHFGTRYYFDRRDLKRGIYSVDLSLPHNREVLFEDLRIILERFVLPHDSRYLTCEGRALVYFWASQIFRNAKPVLQEAKRMFPLFLLGAEDPFHISPLDDAVQRVSALDGVMPYALYRAGWYVGKYDVMRDEYFWQMIWWAQFLRKHAPNAKLFGTLQVAFDDSKVPGSRRPPMYPDSVDAVCRLASIIRTSTMGNTDLGFVVDGAVHAVYDEYYEGAAIERSFPPPLGASHYRIRSALSGTVRLEIMREYL